MNKREFERKAATGKVLVRSPGVADAARLQDISKYGCAIQGEPVNHDRGSTVLVELLAGVTVPGEVRWKNDAACGIEFNVALLDFIVEHLRADAKRRGGKPDARKDILRDQFGRPMPSLPGTNQRKAR